MLSFENIHQNIEKLRISILISGTNKIIDHFCSQLVQMLDTDDSVVEEPLVL